MDKLQEAVNTTVVAEERRLIAEYLRFHGDRQLIVWGSGQAGRNFGLECIEGGGRLSICGQ